MNSSHNMTEEITRVDPLDIEAAENTSNITPKSLAEDDPSDNLDLNKAPSNVHHRAGLNAFVVVVSITAAMGGLVFGFELTGAGGTYVMPGFKEFFGWACPVDESDPSCVAKSQAIQDNERGLITALMTIGAAVGALLNPNIMDRVGRRINLLLACATFTLGAAIQAGSIGIPMMYIGRFIGGCGIGMFATCVPVYIAECSPTDYRGMLVTFWQIGVTIGMLVGQGANVGLAKLDWGWRVSYGGNIVFALVMALLIIVYMPESPRYLAAQGETKKLHNVMSKIRKAEDVEYSIDRVNAEVKADRNLPTASWSDVFSKNNNMRRRVLLGIALQAFNQMSGNEAINFYAPIILSEIFVSANPILLSFFLGIVNLVAVGVSIVTIDRFGRVPLFLIGGVTMMLCQIANSVLEQVDDRTDAMNYTFLASLCIYTFAYHSTWGPLAWDVCAEMFPVRERSKAVSLTTMSNFAFNTAVAYLFSLAFDVSPSGSFAFFVVCIAINVIVIYFLLPETAHRNAGEIDEAFKQHKPKLIRRDLFKTE